jgi:hypothetical protein
MERVIITVADSHMAEIGNIAQELMSRGLDIDEMQELVGVITGSAPSNAWESLAEIPGVASVDAEQETALPPPDSDVQ